MTRLVLFSRHNNNGGNGKFPMDSGGMKVFELSPSVPNPIFPSIRLQPASDFPRDDHGKG